MNVWIVNKQFPDKNTKRAHLELEVMDLCTDHFPHTFRFLRCSCWRKAFILPELRSWCVQAHGLQTEKGIQGFTFLVLPQESGVSFSRFAEIISHIAKIE